MTGSDMAATSQRRYALYLDKLQSLQSQFPQDICVAAEKHMPQVMDLASPLRHVCQLGIVHEPHRRALVCSEVPATHKLAIRMAKGARRQASCCRQDLVLHQKELSPLLCTYICEDETLHSQGMLQTDEGILQG